VPGSSDKENSSASSEYGNGENGNGSNEDDPMDDGAIDVRMDREQKGKSQLEEEDSSEILKNDLTSGRYNSGEKSKFKHYFDNRNGFYRCKICGKSAGKSSTRDYARHIRRQHSELLEKIVPYASWTPGQVKELVRLVDKSIRQNNGRSITYGRKGTKINTIDWKFVTNALNRNRPKGYKISHLQITNKWNNLVKYLPEDSSEYETIQTNGYVENVIN